MADIITDNWRMFVGVVAGAFVSGIVVVIYLREGLRKWLINGDGIPGCPLVVSGKSPLSFEEHQAMCEKEWADHNKISAERWRHNQEIANKDREHIISEFEHLKVAQEKMGKTVEKIFDKLDRR